MPHFDALAGAELLSALLRIGLAVVLGGIIGYERELHGRPAGIRTHMLIALGTAVFTEVGKSIAGADPSRVASQVVTGVGFLGAGTILRIGPEIKGLTSAASIWAVAAIAMLATLGGSSAVLAVTCTALALITLDLVDRLERKLVPRAHGRQLIVELQGRQYLEGVLAAISGPDSAIEQVQIFPEATPITAKITLHEESDELLAKVIQAPGVRSATWVR